MDDARTSADAWVLATFAACDARPRTCRWQLVVRRPGQMIVALCWLLRWECPPDSPCQPSPLTIAMAL